MSDNNPIKVKVQFAPGCFDDFEGTQEELDEFIATIKKMAQSGELFKNAVTIEDDEENEFDNDDNVEPISRRLH